MPPDFDRPLNSQNRSHIATHRCTANNVLMSRRWAASSHDAAYGTHRRLCLTTAERCAAMRGPSPQGRAGTASPGAAAPRRPSRACLSPPCGAPPRSAAARRRRRCVVKRCRLSCACRPAVMSILADAADGRQQREPAGCLARQAVRKRWRRSRCVTAGWSGKEGRPRSCLPHQLEEPGFRVGHTHVSSSSVDSTATATCRHGTVLLCFINWPGQPRVIRCKLCCLR